MRDEECIQFLQNVLPHLHMRWTGFRKVRAQVCKRLQRRIKQLALDGIIDYRRYLDEHSDEWRQLDALCRVSVSRFYRDKQMFAFLEQEVLPTLAQRAMVRGDACLQVWSAGAGAGEEPYTIAVIWQLQLQQRFPELCFRIIATDADANMIQRGQAACYDYSSVKNLPEHWRNAVFDLKNTQYCLKLKYKQAVQFRLHDARQDFAAVMPNQTVDLVLCRNLAFTYFDEPLQQQTCTRLLQVLKPGGALVIGIHEQLPPNAVGFKTWSERLRVFEQTNSQ